MSAAASPVPFTRALNRSSLLVQIAAVLIGTALIAAAARITVPMIPVPMTMQGFAVLAIGGLYGSRLGAATLIAYLVEGAMGLPAFTGGAGLAYMAGPTGGYLVGFVVAATLVGFLVERGYAARPLGAILATLAGAAVIHVFGLPWLATLIGWDKAITFGAMPFLLGDTLKAMLAAAVILGLARLSLGRKV